MELQPYKTFLLDDNTTQESGYIQVFTINDTTRFTFCNKAGHSNRILIYDIDKGTVMDSIPLYREGPDGIGPNIEGYCIHTMDSVYLYDYWQYRLIRINRKGKILERINMGTQFLVPSNNCIIPPAPFPGSDAPVRLVNGNIILSGMNGNMDACEHPTCMSAALYNLKDSTLRFINPYPEIYGNHKKLSESWGAFSYRKVCYDVNNRNEKVTSFPADDHITVYDMFSGESRRFFAGYSAKDRIYPMKNMGDIKSEHTQYLEQTQYSGIFYDKYRDLYYRLVVHPQYEYDLNDRDNTWSKRLSVIILDSRFDKVGEYDIKERSDRYSNTFVSEKGLHIRVLSDNDDYMKFITLTPVKL
jgi:hypothetical protein